MANWRAVPSGRVDCVFPFEEASEAYPYLESNHQVGKVVIALLTLPR